MTSSRSFIFHSSKGGQGVTTMAAAYALHLANADRRVLLVTLDHASMGDMAAVLGMPVPYVDQALVNVTEHLDLTEARNVNEVTQNYDCYIYDQHPPHSYQLHPPAVYVRVVRNCYLALRYASCDAAPPGGLIAIIEPARALTFADVTRCLTHVNAWSMPVDPVLSRAVDSGLLIARLPSIAVLASIHREMDEVYFP